MTDGRVLIGIFLCTDGDGNVILVSCSEYLKPERNGVIEEPHVLGLVMVPGRYIVSTHLDDNKNCNRETMYCSYKYYDINVLTIYILSFAWRINCLKKNPGGGEIFRTCPDRS